MNSISKNIFLMFSIILLLWLIGDLAIIQNIEKKIKDRSEDLAASERELKNCEEQLIELSKNTGSKKNSATLVSPGQEGQLMKLLLNPNLNKVFKINTYDLYSPFFYKPDTESEASANAPTHQIITKETLTELDENGMPKNSYMEDIESKWKGVEISPLKVTFTASTMGMKPALKYFKKLPVNTVRTADFIIDGGITKGTIVFAFPLNE